MKKKLLVAALALGVCLAIAVPALAATTPSTSSTPSTTGQSFTAIGVIKSLTSTAGALSLHIDLGSASITAFIGETVPLRVADKAQILLISDGYAHRITFAQLKVGDRLRAQGSLSPLPQVTAAAVMLVAQRIEVYQPVPVDQLTSFTFRGPVTAVDTTNGTLTLKVEGASRALRNKLGGPLAVTVSAQTQITLLQNGVPTPITLGQVSVGEHAKVKGSIDCSQTVPAFDAQTITVQAAATATPAPAASALSTT